MARRKVWQVDNVSTKRQHFQQRRKETSQNRVVLLERRTKLLSEVQKAREKGNQAKADSISMQIEEIDKKLGRIK